MVPHPVQRALTATPQLAVCTRGQLVQAWAATRVCARARWQGRLHGNACAEQVAAVAQAGASADVRLHAHAHGAATADGGAVRPPPGRHVVFEHDSACTGRLHQSVIPPRRHPARRMTALHAMCVRVRFLAVTTGLRDKGGKRDLVGRQHHLRRCHQEVSSSVGSAQGNHPAIVL